MCIRDSSSLCADHWTFDFSTIIIEGASVISNIVDYCMWLICIHLIYNHFVRNFWFSFEFDRWQYISHYGNDTVSRTGNKEIRHFLIAIDVWKNPLATTHSKLLKVLFLVLSVIFCLFLCLRIKYLENRWMDLHRIHRAEVLGPSLSQVWMSRSKVKVTRDKKVRYENSRQWRNGPFCCMTHCNTLSANNIMQQQMGPFRRCWGWYRQPACGLCLVKHL